MRQLRSANNDIVLSSLFAFVVVVVVVATSGRQSVARAALSGQRLHSNRRQPTSRQAEPSQAGLGCRHQPISYKQQLQTLWQLDTRSSGLRPSHQAP